MNVQRDNFSYAYERLIEMALKVQPTVNIRTGASVRTLRGGVHMRVDLSEGLLPLPSLRKIHVGNAAAEMAWFLSGQRDVTWFAKYAPFWQKFTEEDGVTIANAYGYRWRKHFKRDQLKLAVQALARDPSDRRVWISAWDPATDGLGAPMQKNVPCPVGFTFSVLDGELHSALMLRSSDIFVGLPYDVLGHALLMSAVAQDLELAPGVMSITLAHAHLYKAHEDMALEGLTKCKFILQPEVSFPGWGLGDIELRPDAYVAVVKALAAKGKFPEFNPKPEIVQ